MHRAPQALEVTTVTMVKYKEVLLTYRMQFTSGVSDYEGQRVGAPA
jgi:hypothetical protein